MTQTTTACANCGAAMTDDQSFCAACGQPRPAMSAGSVPMAHAPHSVIAPTATGDGVAIDTSRGYVGFWARFAAGAIDALIMVIPCAILSPTVVGPIIVYWLYSAFMHASKHQATIGRRAMGIVMTNDTGGRVGFGQATFQYLGTLVSGFILGIGYFMIGWTQKKQGLHDMMAGTLHYYRVK